MKLFQFLKQTCALLSPADGTWMVCGGVAASLYRDVPRFTGDIDFAIIDGPTITAQDRATSVLRKLGYIPKIGWVTDQNGKLINKPTLVIGREAIEGSFVGIDFLLPSLPWVDLAVKRASSNLLDYGFAMVPTITAEDLIIAKLFAVQGTPGRKFDLDDIETILRASKKIDKLFIKENIVKFGLTPPEDILKLIG